MEVKKNKLITGGLFILFSLITGLSIGTQYFAYKVNYHNSLGHPLFNKFYNPFSIIFWMNKYKNVTHLQSLINQSTLNIAVTLFVLSATFLIILLKKDSEKNSHGSARWINNEELKELNILKEKGKYSDGIILGRIKNFWGNSQTIIDNGNTHVSMIAPTRSGKGVGVIIPTLLNWRESTVVLDMKNENYSLTAMFRKHVLKQKVLRFAPFDEENSVSFNPLAEVRLKTAKESGDIQVIADLLVSSDSAKEGDHWVESASSFLVGIITYVLYKRDEEGKIGSLGDVYDFLTSPTLPLVDNLARIKNETFKGLSRDLLKRMLFEDSQLEGVEDGAHPAVARMVAECLNKAPNEFAGVVSSTIKALKLFKNPIIRKNTSKADFKVNDLMDYKTPVSLYLVIEADSQTTLAPLVKLFISLLVGRLCPKMENLDEKIHKHKLLLMLDEFPAFGKIQKIQEGLGYVAGYGIRIVIIAQAINQIKNLYGDKSTILDNCSIAVYYAPSPSDYETAKLISNLLGDKTEKTKNKSGKISGGLLDGSISESKSARKLLTPEEVKNLPKNRNIILFAGEKPIKAYKIRYFTEKYFKSKTKLGVPQTDYIKR